MSDRGDDTEARWGISGELRPYVDHSESETIDRAGRWLRAERPDPPPKFRDELRGELAELAADATAWRPRRLALLVVACIALGLALMAVAAISLAGTGPLG